MKSWYNYTLLLCALSLSLFSCEKDEDRVILKEGTPPVLSASTTDLVLAEEEAGEDALTLTWTPSDYGYQAAVNYVLEVDMSGNNFAAPVTSDLGSGKEKTFTVSELNTLLNRLDITPFQANEVEMRVRASVSEFVNPVLSNTLNLAVTPYLTEPPYATLYMVGAATDAGWENTKAIPMLRDPSDLFKFTYTGKFKADAFKFLGQRGAWAPMYGGQNGSLIFRQTEADPDPASIMIEAEGYKTVTVDLRNNTYAIEDYDASAKPVFTSIGIIGTFTEWSSDVLMSKTDFNPHYWTLKYTFPADVEMKFRKAGDWGTNWGAPKGEEDKLFNNAGSENIKVPAGEYLIVFNDLTGNYLFIKQK